MNLIDNMKERASAQIDSQKSRATDTLGVIANAARGTTNQLRDEQHDVLAGYIESAANHLERVSTTLREKDMSTLLSDARRLARRQPMLFIGGSFVVGLLAARFLKSSRQNGQNGQWGDEHDEQWSPTDTMQRGGARLDAGEDVATRGGTTTPYATTSATVGERTGRR